MVFTTRCEASITLSTPEEFSEDIHLKNRTGGRAEPFFSTTSKLVTDLLISIS